MRNGKIKGLVYLSAVLLISVIFSARINEFLKIEIREKTLPVITQPDALVDPVTLPSIDKIIAILLPAGASRSDLYQPAAYALADSIENRTGLRPEILESPDEIPSGWVIAVEPIANAASLQQNSIHAESLEAFALRSRSKGASRILSISSASQLGVIYGMYRLADELRTGVSEQDIRTLN